MRTLDEQTAGTPPRARTSRPARNVRRPPTARQRENRTGLAFLSPTLAVVLTIVVIPILCTIVLAFQDIGLADIQDAGLFGRYTLDNFATVFTSPGFWSSLWTTLIYTFGSTGLSLGIGLVAALALRGAFRGRALVRGAMLLPYVAPVVAVTFLWQVMLNPQFGIVNEWGTSLLGWDGPIAFLTQRATEITVLGLEVEIPVALLTVIVFEGWRYFPFAFLFLLARLQAVPRTLEEAAVVDGATPSQRFRYVLLPQLTPVLALLAILRFIMTFNKFDDVYLLTGGSAGTDVISVRVYEFLTSRFDVGAAAAQALVLAAFLVVFVGIYLRFFAPSADKDS